MQTLKIVDSGTIDIVENEDKQYLQFNCSCADALPFCKAMCCKGRPRFNVQLMDGESEKFKSILHPNGSLKILDHNAGSCCYLKDNKCLVHDDKPEICGKWHCSPGGVGEGIKLRDKGWVFTPALEAN